MTEFKVIETQEEFNKAISDRLKRQEDALQKQYMEKYGDYEELKTSNESLKNELAETRKTLEANKTKAEQYDTQINELTSKVTKYEKENLRTSVALTNGIPYELANRLVGDSEDELIEDAKRLSQLIKDNSPSAPLKNAETGSKHSKEERLYGNLI